MYLATIRTFLKLAIWKNIKTLKSTLRLPGLKARACSGLTLSGASLPRLKRRGLAPSNGSIFKYLMDRGAYRLADYTSLEKE